MHRIRLHGPWSVKSTPDSLRILERDRDSSVAVNRFSPESSLLFEETIQLPQDWEGWLNSRFINEGQALELSRTFGKPTGLEGGQQVWLVLVGKFFCKLRLNESLLSDEPLTKADSNSVSEFRFPIASLLLARNRLQLLIENGLSNQLAEFLFQAVYLEIDEP